VLVHPGLVEEAAKISKFLAEIDPKISLCFLAFRPNFVLENMRGAPSKELAPAVKKAEKNGLENVESTGVPDINGENPHYKELAANAGCKKLKKRECTCSQCDLESYVPVQRI